ncbi:zinc finger protein CONSTANS-LIKE 1-like [Asparagus officinalis]|uniref:zinc finger protein CONSTANS-LIKE 1-like n=1 Tax=Asparagus officinalis TaxID=4686 RepID=UPI00098E78C6|nr:zinc finger protein CONSTANS-LIKE 1-like [Asparagus officinalis]
MRLNDNPDVRCLGLTLKFPSLPLSRLESRVQSPILPLSPWTRLNPSLIPSAISRRTAFASSRDATSQIARSSRKWRFGPRSDSLLWDSLGSSSSSSSSPSTTSSSDLVEALGSTNANHGSTCSVRASFERQLTISELKTEERNQKLSRYRKKKSKRNFGRKIKYACRKALADSQPRVRGRFVKTEDCDFSKALK